MLRKISLQVSAISPTGGGAWARSVAAITAVVPTAPSGSEAATVDAIPLGVILPMLRPCGPNNHQHVDRSDPDCRTPSVIFMARWLMGGLSPVTLRPPVAVRITLNEPGKEPRDITLSYPLDPTHAELLRALHAAGNSKGVLECRMHDDDPALCDLHRPDGRIRGAWLYLRTNPHAAETGAFELSLCHWPGSPFAGSHAVPSLMTDEHRRRQVYIARRGEDAGYAVELERSLAPGTRSDVVIAGTETLTAEVQQSGISVGTVVRRDRRVVAVGATPAWFADAKNPRYAFQVAHVETNEREGMDPRMWTVSSGPRVIEHERCGPGARRPCPVGRNWCGRWHPIWVPAPGLTVDDVVEQVPAGAMIRLDTGGRQGVVLTTPEHRDGWLSEQRPRDPEVDMPRQRYGGSAIRHPNYSITALRRAVTERGPSMPVEVVAPIAEQAAAADEPPPVDAPRVCETCAAPLFLLRPGRTVCERCRIAAVRASS